MSPSVLALFLNCDSRAIYNRRYRLKDKIRRSDAPRKQEYLSILSESV